jgi:hypothetical protein
MKQLSPEPCWPPRQKKRKQTYIYEAAPVPLSPHFLPQSKSCDYTELTGESPQSNSVPKEETKYLWVPLATTTHSHHLVSRELSNTLIFCYVKSYLHFLVFEHLMSSAIFPLGYWSFVILICNIPFYI